MSLKDYSREEIDRMAMIDLANDLLLEEKKALNFHDTFDRVADIKGLSKAKKAGSISQFYTDLNLDGRFLTLGSNVWGLKRWYPVDQIDEEVSMTPKKKKKTAKKSADDLDDEFLEDEDEGLVEIFDDAPAFKAGTKDDDEDEDDEDDDKKVFSEGFGIESEEEEKEEEE